MESFVVGDGKRSSSQKLVHLTNYCRWHLRFVNDRLVGAQIGRAVPG